MLFTIFQSVAIFDTIVTFDDLIVYSIIDSHFYMIFAKKLLFLSFSILVEVKIFQARIKPNHVCMFIKKNVDSNKFYLLTNFRR